MEDRPRHQQQTLRKPGAGQLTGPGWRHKPRRAAARALLAAAFSLSPLFAHAEPLPFEPGERIAYDVSWMGIIGGEGLLEVVSSGERAGRPVYTLHIVGRSTGWVRDLYRVEDHTFSFFDTGLLASRRVEISIEENAYRKKKVIEFDQENATASYRVDNDPPESFAIDRGSQDSFSALYRLRTLRGQMQVGRTLTIPIFEDRTRYTLEVLVARRERLNLPQGMVDTIVVEPRLKTEGIFRRRGTMTIWLSDDERLIPVQMKSRVILGSFYATIREWQGVNLTLIPYPEKAAGKPEGT